MKYLYILATALKNSLGQRDKFISIAFLQIFRILLMLLIYKYTFEYKGVEDINHVTQNIAIYSICAYFWLLSLNIRGIFKVINEDVKTGNIENYLNKPFSYLLYRNFYRVGEGIFPFILTFIISIVLLICLIGFPEIQFSVEYILSVILIFVFGIILSGLLYSLVGLTAVWIEEAEPVYWTVDKLILVLGGSFIPVALYPEFLRTFSTYSPFGAVMFISHIFYDNYPQDYLKLISLQVFWILISFSLLLFMFNKVKFRLNVNGG